MRKRCESWLIQPFYLSLKRWRPNLAKPLYFQIESVFFIGFLFNWRGMRVLIICVACTLLVCWNPKNLLKLVYVLGKSYRNRYIVIDLLEWYSWSISGRDGKSLASSSLLNYIVQGISACLNQKRPKLGVWKIVAGVGFEPTASGLWVKILNPYRRHIPPEG